LTYLKALLKGKIENVSDILELVESHYLPRIILEKEKVRELKARLE